MDSLEPAYFLFSLAQETQRSFETPVILVTMKDYAEGIFRAMVGIRTALMESEPMEEIARIITDYHTEWLQAVQDIENFKKRIKDTPRETIAEAINYTIFRVKSRCTHIQAYIKELETTISPEERQIMKAEMSIINDTHEIVISVLREKNKCLQDQVDQTEYCLRVSDEVEELMNWLDKLNDGISITLTKLIDLRIPLNPEDLASVLKQITQETVGMQNTEAHLFEKKMFDKGKPLGSLFDMSTAHTLKIREVIQKIKVLENRVDRLSQGNSTALMAIRHKTIYLEERLQSLENLKKSLYILRQTRREPYENEDAQKATEVTLSKIFNHILPHRERCRLVADLIEMWRNALNCAKSKNSIAAIPKFVAVSDILSDEIGFFTVDQYGRKLYTMGDNDKLYQLNEKKELVTVTDDDKHIYLFDECGRYFVTEQGKRIYKVDNTASEYELNTLGKLVKIKEERGGIDYHYDNLGRYYVDVTGQRIYKEESSEELYVNDGLSNLVKLRDREPHVCKETCAWEPMVTDESLYLKRTVGAALKKCLADVFLFQPADPIKYLANGLEKYRHNMVARQQFQEQHLAIIEQRELYKQLQLCSPKLDQSCQQSRESEFSNVLSSFESSHEF